LIVVTPIIKSDEDMLHWVRKRRTLVRDLMQAETMLEYGSLRLIYHGGVYVGMDVMQRHRLPGSGNNDQ